MPAIATFASTALRGLKIESKVLCNDHNHNPASDRPKSTSLPRKSQICPENRKYVRFTSKSNRRSTSTCTIIIQHQIDREVRRCRENCKYVRKNSKSIVSRVTPFPQVCSHVMRSGDLEERLLNAQIHNIRIL